MSNELKVAEEATTRKITKEEYERFFERKVYGDYEDQPLWRYKIIADKVAPYLIKKGNGVGFDYPVLPDADLYEYNIESRIHLLPKELITLTRVKQDKEYWIEHPDRYLEDLKVQFDGNQCYFISAEAESILDAWVVEYYDPKQDLCALDPRVNEIKHNRRPYCKWEH